MYNYLARLKNDIPGILPKGYTVRVISNDYHYSAPDWVAVKAAIDRDRGIDIGMCHMHTGNWELIKQ